MTKFNKLTITTMGFLYKKGNQTITVESVCDTEIIPAEATVHGVAHVYKPDEITRNRDGNVDERKIFIVGTQSEIEEIEHGVKSFIGFFAVPETIAKNEDIQLIIGEHDDTFSTIKLDDVKSTIIKSAEDVKIVSHAYVKKSLTTNNNK